MDDALGYAGTLLQGERVRLRELRDADLAQLDACWHDPGVLVLNANAVRPQPEGAAVERFRRWSANDTGTAVGFVVVDRQDDTLVGHITISGIVPKDRRGELAVMIGPPHQSRGYGTDAVRTVVRYGFLELGLNRIELGVYAFNERAVAAYTKAGFVVEGRRRDQVWYGGRFHDDLVMGLLRAEWQDRAGDPPSA
jgi:RimJ/RimL family protein N-acetyltransferase